MDITSIIIGLVVGMVVGIAYAVIQRRNLANQIDNNNQEADKIISTAREQAQKIVSEAEKREETIRKQKIEQNREKLGRMRKEYEEKKKEDLSDLREKREEIKLLREEMKQERSEFKNQKQEIEKGFGNLKKKEERIEIRRKDLETEIEKAQAKQADLDAQHDRFTAELEKISGLSKAEAKERILEEVRLKTENEALSLQKDLIEEAKDGAAKQARKILITTIQRISSDVTIENTVSVFQLDNDNIKGQIIGREGRNIRAIEAATGAELVVDDTPEAIVISSFDPIRREICRLALKRLVSDGRIHPARIEEVVNKTRKELEQQIREIGEKTVIELDIHGLKPDLIRMVGRMRYRSSYGQNLLAHSVETARLCALMAAELGLSQKEIKLAKRAGLLHDIGKVTDEESDLTHALIGMEMCKKAKEHPAVLNAVGAHHDEIDMTSIISPIVQACDGISGARPGARREILESYLKRIKELEAIATAHQGVETAYAMQAGRELRIIVAADKVNDQHADELSFKISQEIQESMQYPGQIKVMVIRERRSVSVAK